MTFDELLAQILELLQRQGRVSYGALKRRFSLDDAYLDDLKTEIIEAQRLAVDEQGRILVWTGGAGATPAPIQAQLPPHLPDMPSHLAEKILTSKAALEGERKQVTVLFADLKGSMELLADRDPEEARQLLDPVLERLMAAVHRYEGTVNQVMGDGIMALFGAPLAHEDHAVRACYAALAMQEALHRYSAEVRRTHGVEVQIRVGLNSGEVVVRAIGNDLHMDYSAIGQTTHLAARMEQLATPGSIRLTAETLRLAEGLLQVTPLGPVPVKGLAEPVEVYELVGASALGRSAYREAVGSFDQALSALSHLPEQRATHEQAIDLRLALRSALRPFGDFKRILAYLHEAEHLAVTLDDPRRLGQVSIFLSNHFYSVGVYDQALAAAQRALALATAGGDVVLQALANLYFGRAYHAQGDYRRGIDCLGQTVASLEGAQRRERFGHVFLPAVTSRVWLAWCYTELGMFAEGRAFGEEGLRIAEGVDHQASLIYGYGGIGLLSLCQGDLPRALPLLERAVDICQDVDLPLFFPLMTTALGAAYILTGRIADAVPLLMQTLKQTTVTEAGWYQALSRLSLGEAQARAGRLEEAHAFAERALALACEHQERGYQAYALRLLGDIAAHRDPPETGQAEAHYRQARALAEALGMRPLQAHCHLGLGTLYGRTGQRQQASTELSTALALYRAMDMSFWLPQAEAALAQVEER